MITNAKPAATRHIPTGRALLRSVAALLALGALAAPASARPFQQLVNGNCVGEICKYDFAKVPLGQRLDVHNVSCYLRMAVPPSESVPLAAAELAVLGATTPPKLINSVSLVPHYVGQHDDQIVLSSNDSVAAFANAQQRFEAVISLYAGTIFETHCQISGDMVKPT
jgi:hypothetical protein